MSYHGSEGGKKLVSPIVAMAPQLPDFFTRGTAGLASTADGKGYWEGAYDGTASPFGDATNLGSPSIAEDAGSFMVGTPDGAGYYFTDVFGCVYTEGDADAVLGDICSANIPWPVESMAVDKTNNGYWLLEADGTVKAFGSAGNFTSKSGFPDGYTMLGIAPDSTTGGYWEVGADGQVYPIGNGTPSHGSWPKDGDYVTAIAATPDGGGYWLLDSSGHVRNFGDAPALPSPATTALAVTITSTPDGNGYWITSVDGNVYAEGDATKFGSTFGQS